MKPCSMYSESCFHSACYELHPYCWCVLINHPFLLLSSILLYGDEPQFNLSPTNVQKNSYKYTFNI